MKKLLLILLCVPLIGLGQSMDIILVDDVLKFLKENKLITEQN